MFKRIVSNISAKHFFYLNSIYSIIAIISVYLLIKDLTIGIVAPVIILPATLVVAYQLLHPPIVKNPVIYFLIPLMVILQTISSNFLYERKIINDKTRLQSLTSTLPLKPTKYTYGKAFNHRSFLVVDNTMFRCSRDRYDNCNLVYDYVGKQATILYAYFDTYQYAKKRKANTYLVYEINVNGKKIYDFDSQRNKFIAIRANLINQLVLLYILLFIPQLLLGYLYIQIIRNLPSISVEEKKVINEQKRLNRINNNQLFNLISGELTISKACWVLGVLLMILGITYILKMYLGLIVVIPFVIGLALFILIKYVYRFWKNDQ